MSAQRNYDQWLWIGVGIALIVGTRMVRQQLQDLADLSSPSKPAMQSTKAPARHEDAITLTTLSTLVQSPDYDIRNAATKILTARIASSPSALRSISASLTRNAHREEAPAEAQAIIDLLRAYNCDSHPLSELLVADGMRRQAAMAAEMVECERTVAALEGESVEMEGLVDEAVQEREETRWRRRHAVAVGGGGGDGSGWVIARPVDDRG